MIIVEFQAKVENGEIVIPDEHKQEIVGANTVKITVVKQSTKQISRPDFMDELAKNPIKIDQFLTRNESHDRNI
ncbi:MAG: hypothetical protein KME43_06350 [Myxacorys chilensis ATA2-1-KO14]|jgi:hypothetical protein|nr:hypothetical protein [Myxacorys chilensis ATA2-1-KO14]